jgi:AcrR family transcriptional regulator
MASKRRVGSEQSETRARILAVTSELIDSEGAAAVTSRRIAAAASINPALVHYYFPTLDDLFVALFRRDAERNMVVFERALGGDLPLRTVWEMSTAQKSSVFLVEFAVLSRQRPALRDEIVTYGRRFREAQATAVRARLASLGVEDPAVSAEAIVVLSTGLSMILAIEEEVGLDYGHREVRDLVGSLLDRFEPG